ncbi:MAG: ATP-dependent DNA helicase, partial [Candidatus Competibacteraceae bacterium]|nr:ATP-dependent DNA helicase [Candidatus Competibacteraceae bacterium]
MSADPGELLGPEGPLAACLPGFRPRVQQQTMARAVARTLESGGVLVAEAGTGTGKTFAYLVPALLSGGKVIISTGTRNLQDQLFYQDLPRVRRALGSPTRTALLKGRANYLCLHRLELTAAGGRFPSREQADQFRRVQEWAGRTISGDINEVDDLPEDSPLWGRVTSTADNCLGSQCPQLQDCHVLKARRLALEADVLVINHHLFFADMAIREEGFAELLPGADGVILDEAHQLSEVAGQFFGLTLTARQLLDLARDTLAEQLKEAPDAGEIQELARALEKAVAELRLALGEGERRGAWAEVALDNGVVTAMGDLEEVLGALARALEGAAPRSKGLENVHQRTVELLGRLTRLAGESP